MFKLLFCVYAIFLCDVFGVAEQKGLRLSLFRQKPQHELLHEFANLQSNGVSLDWLKPRHEFEKKETNHSIALKRYLDSEFYGVVSVGSRNVSFNVIYDTSWTTSWLISKDCASKNAGCWPHTKYDHTRSNTYKPDNAPYNLNEGTYNLTGYYSYEKFNVATLKVQLMRFVEMTDVPYFYAFSKADGVMGLALPTSSTKKTFMTHLLEQGTLKKALFGIYLNRDRQSNRGGDITLGFYDKKFIHVTNKEYDKITYAPVSSNSGLWEFKLDRVVMVDKKIPTDICTTNCNAFVATGVSGIIASKEEVDIINTMIHARPLAFGRYEVDCDTINKLPKIDFVINGNNFTLTGKEYIHKVSMKSIQVCISAFQAASVPSENSRWVIGSVFLANFFSIYDIEKRTIGFVKAA